MDGLSLPAPPSGGAVSHIDRWRTSTLPHMLAIIGMATLMLPVFLFGHASLAGIGVMFACFAWATAAAVLHRVRQRPAARPSVHLDGAAIGDPFAMALLMAVPYIVMGFGGHLHGGVGSGISGRPDSAEPATLLLAVLIIGGWLALRRGAPRGALAERLAFWACFALMVGMLFSMGWPPPRW